MQPLLPKSVRVCGCSGVNDTSCGDKSKSTPLSKNSALNKQPIHLLPLCWHIYAGTKEAPPRLRVRMFDWVSLPIKIQDRVLVNYKWSIGYICYLEGTHEETWCAREDFLPARPGFAGGDWTGDPVYEKFAVLRPNTTIHVLQEFFPA